MYQLSDLVASTAAQNAQINDRRDATQGVYTRVRKQTVPLFCGGIRQSVAHETGNNIANEDSVFKIVAPQKAGITLEPTPCRKKGNFAAKKCAS